MNKYEAMFIIKPDLSEEDRKNVLKQLTDAVSKNGGEASSGAVWSERKKLFFPIKKQHEGVYYLVNFQAPAQAIKELNRVYALNENILRVLISRL